MVKKSRLK